MRGEAETAVGLFAAASALIEDSGINLGDYDVVGAAKVVGVGAREGERVDLRLGEKAQVHHRNHLRGRGRHRHGRKEQSDHAQGTKLRTVSIYITINIGTFTKFYTILLLI